MSIAIEDNLLGYKYGENNLAFQFDYQNTFSKFLVNTELEFVLAGANSPANPWQDFAESPPGTKMFNDGQLEKRLELRINVSRQLGPWNVYAALAAGGRFNKLRLEKPEEAAYKDNEYSITDQIYIWKASDEHEPILRFSIGARYTFGIL